MGRVLLNVDVKLAAWLRRFRKPGQIANSSNVLMVATTFLGDLMMTLPLVAAVRYRHPHANITLMVRPEYLSIAERVKGVSRAMAEPRTHTELRHVRTATPEGFDVGYVAFETRLLPLLAALNVRHVVSFSDPKGRHSRLIDTIIPFPVIKPSAPHQSWIALRMLGYGPSDHPAIRPPYLDVVLGQRSEREPDPDPYLVMHIGARSPLRRWLPDRYAEVIAALASRGVGTVLTGTKEDILLADEILARLPAGVKAGNVVGTTSLLELAEKLAAAVVVFGADTGVMHMAKALGRPVVVLSGQGQEEIYSGAGALFGPERNFYVPDLICRDKHSLHGHNVTWINTCSRQRCALASPVCINDVVAAPVIDAIIDLAFGGPAHDNGSATGKARSRYSRA